MRVVKRDDEVIVQVKNVAYKYQIEDKKSNTSHKYEKKTK